MTEQRADDTTESDKRERRKELHERQKDNWEAVNKALYALMVGHAAGLVACVTLLKDYNAASPGPLKGLGWFITLFGLGLYLAVVSASIWVMGRFNYWVLPSRVARALARARIIRITAGNRWDIPHDKRDWWTLALASISTGLLALAIFIAIFKFAPL
jgi:hypothetical protein